MNYAYDPKNQAQITDYNYYVSPVEGVKQILEKQGSPAAKSELVFPSEQFTAKCDTAPTLTGDEEQTVTGKWIEMAGRDVSSGKEIKASYRTDEIVAVFRKD